MSDTTELTQDAVIETTTKPQATPDYFKKIGDLEFAGKHLIIDIWGAENLTNPTKIEQALKECIKACDASLLHIHTHQFNENGGISGVAVLAESHISVHTWPERNYAAFDIFMCGKAEPENAIPILLEAFNAKKHDIKMFYRGSVTHETVTAY